MICRNSEYYADPTAGKAIANVMREQEEGQTEKSEHGPGTGSIWRTGQTWGIAIVVRAAEEYRRGPEAAGAPAEPERRRGKDPGTGGEFFESAWFCKPTDMEGELILERLRKEAVE